MLCCGRRCHSAYCPCCGRWLGHDWWYPRPWYPGRPWYPALPPPPPIYPHPAPPFYPNVCQTNAAIQIGRNAIAA